VKVSVGDELPWVRTDGVQIERALVNLLENALREGALVEVAAREDAGEVVVQVLDRGPGVEGDSERLFEAFEGGGTGLGLAIARGFAEANGGRVWADARPGGGACFSLALPAVPQEVPV
jgi:two-component system sensor histidine kinase KdpD